MARKNWFWPLAVALLATLLLFWPRREPPKVAQADVVQPIQDTPKLVALTFDDGPKSSTTPRLLEGLAQRGVKATFFLIGSQIEGNEALVRQMDAEGHQIGVHTFDHVTLQGLNRRDFDAQVARTRQILEELLGHGNFLLRPPYGQVDQGVKSWAGSSVILWSVDPEDWHDRDVARETRHILDHVQNGDIILMHDIFPESVDAALAVVDALHAQGYAFVTVDELFAARGVDMEPGCVYRHAPP